MYNIYIYIYTYHAYIYIYIYISCINPAGHSARGFCLGHPAVFKIPVG